MQRKRRRGRVRRIPPHFWERGVLFRERGEQSCFWWVRHGVTRYHSVPLAWVDLFNKRRKRFVFEISPTRWD